MKYCPDCERELPENKFGKNKNFKDGNQPYCLEHYRIRRKQYAKSDRGQNTDKKRKLKFKRSGKQRQYNQTYYKLHRERIQSRKRTETIAGISSDSRMETFKDGKNKAYQDTKPPKKSIVLNPRPVKGGTQ